MLLDAVEVERLAPCEELVALEVAEVLLPDINISSELFLEAPLLLFELVVFAITSTSYKSCTSLILYCRGG